MKRRLLAYMFLAMLLGTGGAIFAQPEFVQQIPAKIESVQQLVATKTSNNLSIIKYSDVVDNILLLLAQALLVGGAVVIITRSYRNYTFHYTQASLQKTPEKEKDRRFSWDDVL